MASVEKRTRNGKTTYSVRYRSPDGKRSLRKVFEHKRDATRWMHDLESAKSRNQFTDPKGGRLPFGPWAERWFSSTAGDAPTTRRDRRMLLDRQVLPTFREVPLAAIDALGIEEWLSRLAAAGLGAKRRREALGVLRLVLAFAVKGRKLAYNVAREVTAPTVQAREHCYLSAGQLEALADAIAPRFGTLVRVAGWCGLRPEELAALRVHHVDLLHGTVRVAEAAPLLEGKLAPGPTKTRKARTVKLPRSLVPEMERQLAGRGPDAYVFTMPEGGPLRQNHLVSDYLKPALRRVGLPERFRFYDLRHTAASLAVREGASVLAVAKLLGHSSPSTTLRTYAHLFPDELEVLAERTDRARTAALAQPWPHGGPVVVPLAEGAGQ